ncbi:hydroxyectoine utilization dehydratase EutB [Rhizobium sp. EC-SD404]|uniref:hydroxyectoine utilization dehydratase EutB n=1 Tax=Rhizobium sp. EC-SD404 TaxID=2038389 RepID=UPI001254E5D5|nr:hydroxyectoine utilization dehydratase EutB [Rhizobium sp. EC-SD404]VVT04590.1 putative threonine dehydratase [Rhizobium sp. EC-SD404]
MTSPSFNDIEQAQATIAGHVLRTPLVEATALSRILGTETLLKLESLQPIGAFKLRGAVNAIMQLPSDSAGVTCCSTGNHGRAVAHAAKARGMRAVVCMSALVPKTKVEGIRALGAEVRIVGNSQDDAQEEAARLVADEGLVDIPPFDHPQIIAGQGTITLEMLEDRPDIETLLIPLSGGGLAAGMSLAAKHIKPSIRVVGISMDRGAAMHESILAGGPVTVTEVASLADSLGGGIGLQNRYSFDLCRAFLDDTVLVTEDDIYRAMQALFFEERIVAEGACVVGIAAMMAGKLGNLESPVATVITGRNVDMGVFTRIMAGDDIVLGDVTVKGRTYDHG